MTSFSRIGFNKWLLPEINGLHHLLENAQTTSTKTSFQMFLENVGIRKVHAQGNSGINLGSFLSGGNITTGGGSGNNPVFGNLNNVTSGLSDLNSSIGGLNNNITNFNTNLTDLNTTASTGISVIDQQAGAFNANLSDLNVTANAGINTIDEQGSAFNQNLSNLNNTANEQGTAFNNNLNQLNNTAADAVSVADKQATDLNKNIADFNKNYANTNANWAESNKVLAKTVDPNHMAKVAFYTAAGAALGSVAVSLAIDGISAGISFLHELFTGAKKKKLEWEDFQKAMQIWDTKLNELIELEKIVDQFINAFAFFDGSNLGNDYLKNLQLAVRDMKFDRDIFMENFRNSGLSIECRRIYYNAADEMDGKIKEYDKILNFISNNSLSLKNPNQYFCTQLKDLQRKILATEVQMQDLRLRILKAENQLYTKQEDTAEQEKGLTLERKIREDLVIADNPELNLRLSDEQMSWLNRIHVDAYCYQYVRVDESKIPEKCKEYPELLYSTALSKGSIKAQDEYKKKCESNYLTGLEKLANK